MIIARRRLFAVFALWAISMAPTAVAYGQSESTDSMRRSRFAAIMELRIVSDSEGCPQAIDLWLVATHDTIHGIEALLILDRPDPIRFVHVPLQKPTDTSTTVGDSLTGVAPTGSPNEIDADFSNGIIANWDYKAARSQNSSSAKITALVHFVGGKASVQNALPPGSHGLLCRLPISIFPLPLSVNPVDSIAIRLVHAQTRLASPQGDLIAPLLLRPNVVTIMHCRSMR